MSRHAAKHHKKAAEHHARAAELHQQASRHYATGNLRKGAYNAQTAHGHALHANDSANEASKHHAREDMDEDRGSPTTGYGAGSGYGRGGDEDENYTPGRKGPPNNRLRNNREDEEENEQRFSSADDLDIEDEDDMDEGQPAERSGRGPKKLSSSTGRGKSGRSTNGRAHA